MAEIEAVVTAPFKGKKAIYMVAAVGVVAVVALVMKSRSGSTSAGMVAADNTDANLAGLGAAIQESNASLQQSMEDSNTVLASGISAIANEVGQQASEVAALQSQIASSLANQNSIVSTIENIASSSSSNNSSYGSGQSSQRNEPVVKTIFGNSIDLTSAMSKFGGQSGYQFVNTEGMSSSAVASQLKAAGSNGLIVGGTAAGVSEAAAAGTGVVRVGGYDRAETASLINSINF